MVFFRDLLHQWTAPKLAVETRRSVLWAPQVTVFLSMLTRFLVSSIGSRTHHQKLASTRSTCLTVEWSSMVSHFVVDSRKWEGFAVAFGWWTEVKLCWDALWGLTQILTNTRNPCFLQPLITCFPFPMQHPFFKNTHTHSFNLVSLSVYKYLYISIQWRILRLWNTV